MLIRWLNITLDVRTWCLIISSLSKPFSWLVVLKEYFSNGKKSLTVDNVAGEVRGKMAKLAGKWYGWVCGWVRVGWYSNKGNLPKFHEWVLWARFQNNYTMKMSITHDVIVPHFLFITNEWRPPLYRQQMHFLQRAYSYGTWCHLVKS